MAEGSKEVSPSEKRVKSAERSEKRENYEDERVEERNSSMLRGSKVEGPERREKREERREKREARREQQAGTIMSFEQQQLN